MISINELNSTLFNLKNREIDIDIISNEISKICNLKKDSLVNLVTFKIFRQISNTGENVKGIVSVDGVTAKVSLTTNNGRYIVS